MQWTQISGVLDRVLIAVGMYAVAKGWISESDMMQFVALLLAIGGAVWGWYVNTNKSLVQAAAAIPGTVVVTTPALANATPNESNIVSNNSAPQAISAAVADSKTP
jgi:hypothetical protein